VGAVGESWFLGFCWVLCGFRPKLPISFQPSGSEGGAWGRFGAVFLGTGTVWGVGGVCDVSAGALRCRWSWGLWAGGDRRGLV